VSGALSTVLEKPKESLIHQFSEKKLLILHFTGFEPVTCSLEGCCSIQLS
jgi:hypothetical protein